MSCLFAPYAYFAQPFVFKFCEIVVSCRCLPPERESAENSAHPKQERTKLQGRSSPIRRHTWTPELSSPKFSQGSLHMCGKQQLLSKPNHMSSSLTLARQANPNLCNASTMPPAHSRDASITRPFPPLIEPSMNSLSSWCELDTATPWTPATCGQKDDHAEGGKSRRS